jgi:very-short-patch-repair endonuclease
MAERQRAEQLSEEPLELRRCRQLFEFLKAFAQRNEFTVRKIADQLWSLPIRELPSHETISVGRVEAGGSEDDGADDNPLLRVRRPRLINPPAPPLALDGFVKDGWKSPNGAAEVEKSRAVQVKNDVRIEQFESSPERVQSLAEWRVRWSAWAEKERPAVAAMTVFERLYELYGRIDRESEQVELVLGDGRLRWSPPTGSIDHPVVLQRVDLEFDAAIPEFRVFDADRGPELYSTILTDSSEMDPAKLAALRTELERGGYHPLGSNGISGYLRRLVQLLGPRGTFEEDGHLPAIGPDPAMLRDPVLLLRKRSAGFAAAFERVLDAISVTGAVPPSLGQLVGVHKPPDAMTEDSDRSPWAEPEDVLLSKPANAEQIQVVQALERHRAIVVQGPPGTGKSHTIGNLIGHLVAQGKRVLVTSHTTKALRVLRDQIEESLRPLCVAVLENDLEGKKQMENAVRGILSRLTTANAAGLGNEIVQLTKARKDLNERIGKTTNDLKTIREAEYSPIIFEGSAIDPAEAARWVREQAQECGWIPGPVAAGAPIALSEAELHELYATTSQLSPAEETDLAGGLPVPAGVLIPRAFEDLIGALGGDGIPAADRCWSRSAVAAELPALGALLAEATAIGEEVEAMASWQRALVDAGWGQFLKPSDKKGSAALQDAGESAEAEIWQNLAMQVDQAVKQWESSRKLLLENDVRIPDAMRNEETAEVAMAICGHLAAGGSAGALQRLLHPGWSAVIKGCRVNGSQPRSADHFRAIAAQVRLDESRRKLRRRWEKQAEPIGMPDFASMGAVPEQRVSNYTQEFGRLLKWYEVHRARFAQRADEAGFAWEELGRVEGARMPPGTAFDLEYRVISGPLRVAVQHRVAMADKDRALGELRNAEQALASQEAGVCRSLRDALRAGNVGAYSGAWDELQRLAAKTGIWKRRTDLLARLEATAPGWARAIRSRSGEGERVAPTGDIPLAWRWRQLAQEIDRRAGLNERELTRRLEMNAADLRRTTAELIDRMAWSHQLDRTDGTARQALQGWADTQRKLGRGTGKRAPQLRAQLRGLLAQAQNAVPVWIMPLARVAEGIAPDRSRFDVVIVDEASQSDVMGLLAWYLGDQIAIVGDHEQVSPLGVGQNLDAVQKLIDQHLDGIPNSHLYDGSTSIYDLARQSFGGTIALKEHFRCVPDIIEFSNELCYNFEIRPLRDSSQVQRPFVAEFVVEGWAPEDRVGKINRLEAHWAVALMEAMFMMAEYDGKTFGAITLLGDEQAGLIQDLAARHVGAVELERRHFVAGNSAQFQGDERHVMLLSMVDTPQNGPLAMRQTPAFKQRYNVAASRAKDQLWLIHSLDPSRDLKEGDLRRRLIGYIRDPGARRRALRQAEAKAESPFELEVVKRLIAAGYSVTPQWWVGGYRIDMVVGDGIHQAAVECDGEKYHGLDAIPADMARQAVLERVGWRFIRIRGCRFFRDPDATMSWVFDELKRLEVRPGREAPDQSDSDELKARVIRSAWEIMKSRGWLPESVAGPDGTLETS